MNIKFLLALAAVCAGVTLAKGGGAAVPPLEKNRERALSVLAENVYGVRPDLKDFKKTQRVVETVDVPEFGAVRQTVELNVLTPIGERTFKAYAYFPKSESKVPAFVYLAFRDPKTFDKDQGWGNLRWDVKDVLARGFATAAFDYQEAFPDTTDEIAEWGRGPSRPADGWGAVSCWALAASRVADWLVTCPQVDADRLGVVGLSRLGKTALWAGATDQRFALVASVCSGCFGSRFQGVNWRGETVEQIVTKFPHWFAPNCRKLVGKDRELPFGQHWLLASIAPRLLVVASAEDDWWACPSGEMFAWELSREAWGRAGDRSHYFVRKGEHNIRESNWIDILDFVRSHGWQGSETATIAKERK